MQRSSIRPIALLAALALGADARAQDDEKPAEPAPSGDEGGEGGEPAGGGLKPAPTTGKAPAAAGPRGPAAPAGEDAAAASARQRPPVVDPKAKVTIDFVDTPLQDVVKYMAEITGRNFILTEELSGKITILSHQQVSVAEAYEAFLSALQQAGYTTVTVGQVTKVVPADSAANNPLRIYEGGDIPYTDNYVTQIIQLENVLVGDISSVVKELAGKGARIIAYAPTNTLIITDAAVNIRRVYRIISQLDVASPKARLEFVPLRYAQATEIQRIIQDLYGGAGGSSGGGSAGGASPGAAGAGAAKGRRAGGRGGAAAGADAGASSSQVGSEGSYIEKIIADERTNSLVVLANDEAIQAVKDLIAQLDIDVDPSSRAQIHVIYLEHAKAEEVAQVLSNLSQAANQTGGRGTQGSRGSTRGQQRPGARPTAPAAQRGPASGDGPAADGEGTSAVAAFETGLRVAHDENTNSLVLIATRDQLAIIKQVVDQLDIRRKQVFIEAVILELSTSDDATRGLGVHLGKPNAQGGLNVMSAQLGASSVSGVSADLLSGVATGVFGPSLDVPITGPDGSQSTLAVPAFGVVLNALQSTSSVNILSTPNIVTTDNEEGKIVVGKNVPFPVGTGRDNNNNPIISFQREDVAITLKVTPQINESNFVTLEVYQEVQEIEGNATATDPLVSGGPTTSKRTVESTVVVRDNQTIVLGGLMGETETETEAKVPILGDLPLIGALFRSKQKTTRKTNLLVFLTPHIIDDQADFEEIYRVKAAQREEFVRRFYGKSREAQEAELSNLLSFSMNQIDQPSRYRGPSQETSSFKVIGEAPQTPAAPPVPAPPPPASPETPPSP